MIRQASEKDLASIANVHIECFPNSFSTKLGEAKRLGGGILLIDFYKEYLRKVPDLFLVAENEAKVIQGFCMGYYCEDNKYVKNFFKHNLFRIGLRIVSLLISFDKTTWNKVGNTFKKRTPFVVLDNDIEAIPLENRGDLLSICVLSKCRGNGMAQDLISRYEEILRLKNKRICMLTVATDNMRGSQFL